MTPVTPTLESTRFQMRTITREPNPAKLAVMVTAALVASVLACSDGDSAENGDMANGAGTAAERATQANRDALEALDAAAAFELLGRRGMDEIRGTYGEPDRIGDSENCAPDEDATPEEARAHGYGHLATVWEYGDCEIQFNSDGIVIAVRNTTSREIVGVPELVHGAPPTDE